MFNRADLQIGAWFKRKLAAIVIFFLLAVLISYVLLSMESSNKDLGNYSPAKAEAYMNGLKLSAGKPSDVSLSYEGTTLYRVAESGGASLWLDPTAGDIALKQGNTVWMSRPSRETLQDDSSAGLNKTNLQSSITLRYLEKGKISETPTNTAEQQTEVKWQAIPGGVGVQYDLKKIGVVFYIEYALDEDQLVVRIPELGVLEKSDNRVTSFEVLPYFGANKLSGDGYLFVPDGPGGVIRFKSEQPAQLTAYDQPIYGPDDVSADASRSFGQTAIAFPVFGMNRVENGFIGIVEAGATVTNVVAAPAGVKTTFNQISTRITVRKFYRQPVSKTEFRGKFEERLGFSGYQSRYITLPRESADYVGMAKAYRDYLIRKAGVKPLGNPQGLPPLFLNVLLGATELTPTGAKLVKMTELGEVAGMAEKLQADGVSTIQVGLEGWQQGGTPGTIPNRFPIDSDIGGNSGLQSLAAELKKHNIALRLDDRYHVVTTRSGYSTRKNGVRTIAGYTYEGVASTTESKPYPYSWINPGLIADRIVPEAVRLMKKLGVSGIGFEEWGGLLYSDYQPSRYMDRETTIRTFQQTMAAARDQLGTVATSGFEQWLGGSGGGAAYNLGYADHLFHFPLEGNYHIIVDEQVPFYPIAVHGLVTYSGSVSNLRADPVAEWLRQIEYGAVSSFLVTGRQPVKLRYTLYPWLYTSEFNQLQTAIKDEYKQQADIAADVWGSFIDGHRKLADGVYETTYEGGRKIWVNYNDTPYQSEGHQVGALSYAVVEKGGVR